MGKNKQRGGRKWGAHHKSVESRVDHPRHAGDGGGVRQLLGVTKRKVECNELLTAENVNRADCGDG